MIKVKKGEEENRQGGERRKEERREAGETKEGGYEGNRNVSE